jgi:regulator of sigma E protease
VTTLLSFLFVLGVLIFVHELGHFLVARRYGVRVVTFSLGFGPKILKVTRGDTQYCVGIIPLGGYVKLAGETVQDDRVGAPDEFLSKSKWVRFQVYLAGPLMNFVLAVAVMIAVLARGADVPLWTSAPVVVGTVQSGSPAERAGIRAGDRIVAVAGRATPTWESLAVAVLPKANRELDLEVERGGARETLRVTVASEGKYEMGTLGIGPTLRPEVVQVQAGRPADRAGMRRGDVILAVDGATGLTRDAIIDRIRKSGGTPIVFTMERDGQTTDVSVTAEGPSGSSLIGASILPYEVRRVDPSWLEAVGLSVEHNWNNAALIASTLGGLFKGETPVRQLMGPVAIAELSGSAAEMGWIYLFELMAMISLNLGLLNLLPVPVLDGGQIAILAVEGLARRDMSLRVKERILIAGAALIMLLMVTVIYNDVARLLR